MKSVFELVNSFLEAELKANQSKWNLDLPDEDVKEISEACQEYCHSILGKITNGRAENMFDDDDVRNFAPTKLSRAQKRPLYQIRKYENPKFGDVIKRVLKENVIYLCYTGNDEAVKKGKSKYRRVFVVAETDEGLKIVSYFRWSDSELEQRSDYTPTHINKLNNVVGVEKYIAPEEGTSLADYNKD